MGDRANVYMREDTVHGVYLYTHWGGHGLPEVVRVALDSPVGRGRWSDGPYLARIIFCAMLRRGSTDLRTGEVAAIDALTSATGYGISAQIGDNSYPIIVVDSADQHIGFAEEPKRGQVPKPKAWMSFEDYIKTKPASWALAKSSGVAVDG